jgi:NAD(P)-dependent dehydrogenase (short-subunit alcohol dehydrogenase family)
VTALDGGDLLRGKVVLVTGAGGGVGKGIALACGQAGADVVVTARSASGDETTSEILERGGSALSVRCDVTDRADVERAVAQAKEAFGGLDAMVHNATSRQSSQPHALEDAGLDLWEEHAAVSVRGSLYCAQAAHAELAARGGTLILLSSPAGIEGSDNLPFYGMVKGAQRALVKSLAQEWGPDGIRVNALAPLAVSEALGRAFEADASLQAKIEAIVPLRRIGESEADIGYVAAFLVSEWSRYVTGQTLLVSGGRLTLL